MEAKVICTHCCEPMEIPSKAVLQTQLTQLQALVREVDSLLKGIIKRNQGGYVGDKDDIRKAISLIAALGATTPAPPTHNGGA